MSIGIKVTLGKNTFAAEDTPVWVPPDGTVMLEAHDSGNPVAGSWSRNGTKVGDDARLEIKATATTAGKHTFTSTKKATKSIEVKLDEKHKRAWTRVVSAHTVWALLVIVAYALVSLYLVGSYGNLEKVDAPATGDVASSAMPRSLTLGLVTLAAMLALAEFAGRAATGTSGVMDLIKGKDRRASNSKIQFLMWTLLLGFILAYVAGYSSIVIGAPFECSPGVTTFCVPTDSDKWGPNLVLLGVPAAAAVTAKGVVSYKVANGTLQKTEAQQPALAQVVNNDSGDTDIVDVQYLMFNLIAFVYVLAMFATRNELADVPNLLLGLTSAAAGTYVLNKSLANNKPRITSVVPGRIKPGDVITIQGENLLIAGADGKKPTNLEAKVAGVRATATAHPSLPSSLVLTVPEGIGGTQSPHVVTVVTPANVEAEGFPVTIEPITVVGWAGAQLPAITTARADRVEIIVTGLPALQDLTPANNRLRVVIAGIDLAGKLVRDDVVEVDIPQIPSATSPAEVKVGLLGRTSEAAKLPVA